MRSLLVVGVLIALCVSADAQTFHRAKSLHPRTRQHLIVRPVQGVAAPARFAVPGWSDDETQRWLDNATSCWDCG